MKSSSSATSGGPGDAVAERYRSIRSRMAAVCNRAGRPVESVTLIGASKVQPIDRLRAAFDAGLRVFGENRVQEARDKQPNLPAAAAWHLLGPLQSNKARLAVSLFSVVHSIDRPKIARVLDREAGKLGRRLDGFIEVNLANEPTKHGFATDELLESVAPLAELEYLRIVGLMAIPPFESEAERAREWFRRLRDLRDRLLGRREWADCPGQLSMGMSHDFEQAIEVGATHVRVGTDLFGPRPAG